MAYAKCDVRVGLSMPQLPQLASGSDLLLSSLKFIFAAF